ncbi:hypothetical protein GCM10020295_44210 [Streptomyces cinereospinus]
MIRVAAVTVARFAMMAGRAIAWAAVMAAQWLVAFWPIALVIAAVAGLVALVVIYWDEIKAATLAAWDWVVDKLRAAAAASLVAIGYLAQIPGWVRGWFNQAKDWAIDRAVALVTWVRGLPGRLSAALSTMLGVLRQRATTAFQALRDAGVQRALTLVTWLRGLPGRIASAIGSLGGLLVGKGRDVVIGLWNGIRSMGGWLRSQLISFAKGMIPGPIAKALGIASPSKLMADAIGRWIPPGIVEGAEDEVPAMNRALSGMVDVPGLTTVNRARSRAAASAAGPLTIRWHNGGGDAFMDWLQRQIRIDYGGDVTNLNTTR